MRLFVLIVFALWMKHQSAFADHPRVKMTLAINAPGSAPYLYLDEKSQTYKGVVADFIAVLAAKSHIKIEYLETSRSRAEGFTRTGVNDLFLSSKAWLSSKEGFIFSDPFIEHKSYLYSVKPFEVDFDLAKLKNELVCTRYGYTYPVLQAFFESGNIVRVNSSSQLTMTSMLVKNRCDYSIMNEFNARAAFLLPSTCDTTFFQSPELISKVDLVFVINPKQQAHLPELNRQLRDFIISGQRDKAILQHTGGFSFPFRMPCTH